MMKRYRVGEFVEPPIEERDGGWVRYSDHLTVLKEAREAVFTEIGVELRRYGANIRKVDLMARFQELFREGDNSNGQGR